MPENVPLPIANGYYLSDTPIVSAQQCINFYPNIVQAPALTQETLIGTAGLFQVATTGVTLQSNRGSLEMSGIIYFVNGTSLYRLNRVISGNDITYTTDNLGTIEGTERVSMATNGRYLVVQRSNGVGSVWDEQTDTFTPSINVEDNDFTANGNPISVVYVDGYFLFPTDEKKFIISSLNNPLEYNALDFGSAESDPDEIKGAVVYDNQVFILGSKTIEAFDNVGGAGFPFVRNGLFDDTGLLAPNSVVLGDDAFRFVGAGKNEGPGIYEFKGNQAVKISNTAIDTVLQDLSDTDLEAIHAFHYGQNGQFFTSFIIDGADECFEFNSMSGRWHQRQSFIDKSMAAWRVSSISYAYGFLFAFDRIDGRVGILDEDLYTEYGDNIRRTLDTMPFANNDKSASISRLELTVQSGVGNSDVEDPVVRMSRSGNGGKTFTSELSRRMGKAGDFGQRLIWRRLGRVSKFEMFRFELTDAVKPAFIQLTAAARGGL